MSEDKNKLICQSEVGKMRNLIVKHPREAFINPAAVESQWRKLNYLGPPDLPRAIDEYDKFIEIVGSTGVELRFLDDDRRTGLDSIYVRDAAVVCDQGAILCSMGKPARRGEPAAMGEAIASMGIPILGTIAEGGLLEGGDVVWIGDRTLLVGQGYRTNAAGIRQLGVLLGDCVDEIFVVQLPHWRGADDVFHLMSILSPVDEDKALAFLPLMPVALVEKLREMDIRMLEVPEDEFETMACNALALSPGKILMLSGNRKTRAILEKAGVEVFEYDGNEISVKGAGGPTCLTRPFYRLRKGTRRTSG